MLFVVETVQNPGEPSSATRRVRVVEGQGIDQAVRVSCSRSMRLEYELGQRFLLDVQWKYRDGNRDCLYANPRDKPHPLSNAAAANYIAVNFGH